MIGLRFLGHEPVQAKVRVSTAGNFSFPNSNPNHVLVAAFGPLSPHRKANVPTQKGVAWAA
jgi:hypothetical protein